MPSPNPPSVQTSVRLRLGTTLSLVGGVIVVLALAVTASNLPSLTPPSGRVTCPAGAVDPLVRPPSRTAAGEAQRVLARETQVIRDTVDTRTRARATSALVRSAQRRKAALLELAANDPQGANAFLLTDAERAVLKTRTTGCVEEPATLRGTVSLLHADYSDGTSRTQPLLITDDGERLELHVANPPGELRQGDRLEASGFLLDDHVFVDAAGAADQTAGLTILEPATASPVLGARKVVVLLTYFQNQIEPDVFPGEDDWQRVSTIMKNTSRYFWENSYGKMWLSPRTGGGSQAAASPELLDLEPGDGGGGGGSPILGADVYGYYQLAINRTCNLWEIRDAAIAAAAARGIDIVGQYDAVVFVGPFAGCGWGGVYDGAAVFLSTLYEGVAPQGIGHELAHALLSLHHAHFLDCGEAALRVDPATCTHREYGDFYDTMGSSTDKFSPRHLSVMRKAAVGWLDADRPVLTVTRETITPDGVYALSPLESPRPGLKGLKIPRSPFGDDFLWVEFRQPIGFDQGMDESGGRNVFAGPLLHIRTVQTYLLDASAGPGNPGDIRTVALPPGETFTDPFSGVSVQAWSLVPAGSVDDAQFLVQVALGPEPLVELLPLPEPLTGTVTVAAQASAPSGFIEVLFIYRPVDASPNQNVEFGRTRVPTGGDTYTVQLDTLQIPNGQYVIQASMTSEFGWEDTDEAIVNIANPRPRPSGEEVE